MKNIFLRGLWKDHPALRQLLGMCSTLAVTTTAINGISMGLGVMFVLVSSALLVSLIRHIVPPQVRIAVYAVIIATFVTIVDIFLKAQFPSVSESLGPYVPLIIVNCIILGRVEAFACKNGPRRAVVDAFAMAIGYAWVLLVLGATREILAGGTVFGHSILPETYNPLIVAGLPAGAFILLGFLVAIMNRVEQTKGQGA
ncbi:MAG: electron transport complex subunit RsxE [Candidatus Omnitrophota bacterium]